MKKLLYTFSAILLLLATFLGIWWSQSYRKNVANLRQTVEGEVNRLVTDEFVYATLQTFMRDDRPHRAGAIFHQNFPGGRQRMIRIERIVSTDNGNPEYADITIISNGRPIANTHFFYENKYIALEELPQIVRDSMQRKFGIQLEPIFFQAPRQRYNDRFGTHPDDPLTVRVKHLTPEDADLPKASFVIRNYRGTVLLDLIPEFLFGLILFGATGFAFASAYRNIHEQKQQLQAKDALVANVAHELKTPIATVGVALEALNVFGADADPARRQEYLSIGQTELKRLNEMADRAIDSLQDEDLAGRLSLANVDLKSSVDEAWRGLSLRYGLPDESLTLSTYGNTVAEVDEHYWHHLVYNLLDNACKYGGRPLAIDVNIAAQSDQVVLTVSDNGRGIPQQEREKVFDRFYRIYRPAEGHTAKGHGLGLSFVRQIARAHGGGVRVDNNSGGGARFTVTLPNYKS
ncbi:ATP-binding protein [Lewinella sp. 4G2]|uniref:ATP-binding protein n=1 Tax=Lewinella sp. 4G2 TaxID=1803372 RepID=UPI0008319093|nr:ATP-binding protein [Lewinella sp. 4G2]